jgi:hypothetical protein
MFITITKIRRLYSKTQNTHFKYKLFLPLDGSVTCCVPQIDVFPTDGAWQFWQNDNRVLREGVHIFLVPLARE